MRATVYARMRPDQKTQLVKALQNLEYEHSQLGKRERLSWNCFQSKLFYKQSCLIAVIMQIFDHSTYLIDTNIKILAALRES